MTVSGIAESQRKAARIAGFASLISFPIVVAVNFGIFARLIIRGNPTETALAKRAAVVLNRRPTCPSEWSPSARAFPVPLSRPFREA